MAMSAVCQLSLALLAVAFASSNDWDEVAHSYSDKFYHGPADGEFGHYLPGHYFQHGSDFSKFADHFSQDRLDEAKRDAKKFSRDTFNQAKGEGHWFSQHHMDHTTEDVPKQAKGGDKLSTDAPVALAAAPVEQKEEESAKKSSGEKSTAADHQQAEHHAEGTANDHKKADNHEEAEDQQPSQHHAEAAIGELQEWHAKLEADLKDKDFPVRVAKSIASKAKADTFHQRNQLEGAFDSALDSIGHAANATEASRAEHVARESAKELLHLDGQERKAMRETLHSIEKQGKHKARALWKTARDAAHQAYHQGMAAARAQRKGGVAEHIYERAMGDAERVSERLSGHAEHVAEGAEDLLERQSGKVEHQLEGIMDKEEDEAHRQHEKRLHEVSERAREAKRAHEADHASAAHDSGAKAKPEASQKQGGHPSAFLASSEPMGLSISAVAGCALAVGLITTLLVFRLRAGSASMNMENPLLG